MIKNTENDVCKKVYDLCIIDGPKKNSTIDGAAFFMADKLLKDNGWIIFDDYKWTYSSRSSEATDGVTHRQLSEPELNTPHINEIFELLVKQHPAYGNLHLLDNSDWAIAQKTRSSKRKYIIIYDISTKDIGSKILLKLYHRISK